MKTQVEKENSCSSIFQDDCHFESLNCLEKANEYFFLDVTFILVARNATMLNPK